MRSSSVDESTDVVGGLMSAAASRGDELGHFIDDVGAAPVARLVLDEIVFRACLADLREMGGSASVTIAFAHRGREHPTLVSVGPEGVRVQDQPTRDGWPPPVVSQDLAEAVRALYGPRELVSATTRAIRWPGPEVVFPTPDRPSLPRIFYAVVQRVIQVLDRDEPADLAELAVRYGTDKWGSMHQYPQHYQRHFGPIRDHRLTILEIGVGGTLDPVHSGASMKMWKRYFPRAMIYGLDVVDKSIVDASRLTTIMADQSRPEDVTRVAQRFGPFDIVIDDGSHVSRHVITSFQTLFPYLRGNGLYVVEDLQACYWPEVYGGSDTDLNDPSYTVGFLKTLLDGLHHEEFLRPDARNPQPTDAHIKAVHVYRNLAVVEKGPNLEGSVVATVFRAGRSGNVDHLPTLGSYRKAR
jgi:mycinamicin biosynthesis methyltransferase MycE-like protein